MPVQYFEISAQSKYCKYTLHDSAQHTGVHPVPFLHKHAFSPNENELRLLITLVVEPEDANVTGALEAE